jgi:hypothetical protein
LNDLRELRDGIDPEVPKPKGERGSKKFGFLNQLRERKEWRARHEESSNPGLTRRYWFYAEGGRDDSEWPRPSDVHCARGDFLKNLRSL